MGLACGLLLRSEKLFFFQVEEGTKAYQPPHPVSF